MSLRTRLALPVIATVLSLGFLVGCGSSNGTSNGSAPPSGGFSNSNLNGTYVFSVSGVDNAGNPYAMVGSFTANGSGAVSSGTVDINDEGLTGPVANAAVSGGNYSVGSDGRGNVALATGSNTPFGTITLDFALQDSSHGLISEFDGNASGSGTVDVQTSGATPSGAYAFILSGANVSTPFASVGNFTVGSGGAISAGFEDFNSGGITYTPAETVGGTIVAGPSATPGSLLVTSSFSLAFDVYPISASHLKLIEMDSGRTLAGDAYSQTSTSIPAGTLAFTLEGGTTAPVAAGGFMVTDGSGNITNASTEDYNNSGTAGSTQFSGQYSSAQTGRYTLSGFSGFFGGTTYAAYPSSGGIFMLEIDSSGMMVGSAVPQTSGATLNASQGYALNMSATNQGSGSGSVEVDDIAEFTANSSGLTIAGVIDENFDPQGGPVTRLTLNGTYTTPDSNGRGQVTATAGNSTNSTLNGGFTLVYYTADGTTFPFIDVDSSQVGAGVFVQQNASASASAAAQRRHMYVVQPLVRPGVTRR